MMSAEASAASSSQRSTIAPPAINVMSVHSLTRRTRRHWADLARFVRKHRERLRAF
jgi:hypothetical protein